MPISKKNSIYYLFFSLAVTSSAQQNLPIFTFDANTLDSLKQKNAIVVQGDLSTSVDRKYIDFGTSGCARIDTFAFPSQQYTIEALILLKKYGLSTSNYIADIMNNMSWNDDWNEGISFRVGGGHFYPLNAEEIYLNEETVNFNPLFTGLDRAYISQCIGEVSLGTGKPHYKEAYANRGVALNKWYHYVFTWDGKEMRIYLNGCDVSDTWRTQGRQMTSNVPAKKALYFGIRNFDGYDERHFNGLMNFIHIYDYALPNEAVQDHYFHAMEDIDSCDVVISVKSPKFGDTITGDTRFEISIDTIGLCDSTALSMLNKKLLLVLSNDPLFEHDTIQYEINSLSFTLKQLQTIKPFILNRYSFWKFKIVKSQTREFATTTKWSDIVGAFSLTKTPISHHNSLQIKVLHPYNIHVYNHQIFIQGVPFQKIALYRTNGTLIGQKIYDRPRTETVLSPETISTGIYILMVNRNSYPVIIP
ncbi:MAG: LamG domain-containing protein [Chitinivibrionales bacterium]|nr:LamG domain-containing protein [Chitinivibrionales bacterium]